MLLNPQTGGDTALHPGAPTLWALVSSFRAEEVQPRTRLASWGVFGHRGRGRVYYKNLVQRGELICSVKPKPECRKNVFAHNIGLIRLNQNALICISTQDNFNPTCSFKKYTPKLSSEFFLFLFFFLKAATGLLCLFAFKRV